VHDRRSRAEPKTPSGEFRGLELPDSWLANSEIRPLIAIDGRGDSGRAVDRYPGERLLQFGIGRHSLSWQLIGVDLKRSILLEIVGGTGNNPLDVYYTKQMLESERAKRNRAATKGESLKKYHLND